MTVLGEGGGAIGAECGGSMGRGVVLSMGGT